MLLLCAIVILFYIIYWVAEDTKFKKEHKLLPGPIKFPIIGSTIQIGLTVGEGTHAERVHRICKKYGSPCAMQLGIQYYALISDYEIAKKILNSNDWSRRFPAHDRYREHTFFKYLGLITNFGESWREMRKFSIRALRPFGFGKVSVSEKFMAVEMKHLLAVFEKMRIEGQNEVFFDHIFRLPSFNVIWVMLAGYRFDYDDPKVEHLIKSVMEISELQIGVDLEWQFPILRFVPGFAHSRAKAPWFIAVQELLMNLMIERRKNGSFKVSQDNFIDLFLKQIDDLEGSTSESDKLYTDEQCLTLCFDLVVAAVETTGNSVEWSILFMLMNPHIQKKIHEEIDTVVGYDRTPTMNDRSLMPYTEAIFLETIRFGNPFPIIPRTAVCDTEIDGCFIPKDTMAPLLLATIHNDPKIWGDPHNFRPERFLDENKNIINEQYILGFGGGIRTCIGQAMGKTTWFIFFTTFLQKYSLSLATERTLPSLTAIGGVTNVVRPHYAIVKLRDKPLANTEV